MVTYLGSLVWLCCGEGGTLQTNITGVCGECSQCLGHTGLAHSVCVFPSILLRLQVALQGNCLKQALGCVYFPGLSRSGSWVLHKDTDSVGPEFYALPRSKQLRRPGAWRVHSPQVGSASYHLPPPTTPSQPLSFLGVQRKHLLRCALCLLWGADLWLQSSWQISTIQDPRQTWLATGSLRAV